MAPAKEVRFFNRHFDRGQDWYSAQFQDVADAYIIGEATPRYMADPIAMERISEVLPSIRMIAILRNPIDRTYSHYFLSRARNREDRTFGEVVADELAGRGDTSHIATSRYLTHLDRIQGLMPHAPLHLAKTDDLATDPESVYRGLCRFLGVSEDYLPSEYKRSVNSYVEFRSLGYRDWVRRHVPHGLLRRVLERPNVKRTSYPRMDPKVRSQLADVFRNELDRFGWSSD